MKRKWQKMTREERIEALQRGIENKMSAAEIAAEIDGCTRNAVCGLANRAGLKLVGVIGYKPKDGSLKAGNMPIIKGKPDWITTSKEDKEKIIRAAAAKGMTSIDMAEMFSRVRSLTVKKFASVNGIKINRIGGASKRRSPMRKAPPQTWVEMPVSAKATVVKAYAESGKSAEEIAVALKTTKKAVRSLAERQGIKTPRQQKKKLVNIMQIQSGQCRAPMWQDAPKRPLRSPEDWNFCAQPVQPGSSYCPECHSRFWVTPEKQIRYDGRKMGYGYGR